MISERAFSRSFSGFWEELLPLLTPSLVHMVNEGHKRKIVLGNGFEVPPVDRMSDSSDSALVAEYAFMLAKEAVEDGESVDAVFQDTARKVDVLSRAGHTINAFEDADIGITIELTPQEHLEALFLARNYEYFFDDYERRGRGGEIVFNPKIPGAGFLASCEADVSIGAALFEVKTVARNIAGNDIRQLLVYLALQAATGNRRWGRAGFLNPRRALYHEFSIDDFISQISGGKSAIDVFQEIVAFACTRDVQLDTDF